MIAVLRDLFTNLGAGARVALFLHLARARFRIDAAQLFLLLVVSALIDGVADWVRQGPASALDWTAIHAELASFAVLVAIAALLAWAFSDPPLLTTLPLIVLASLPLVQIINVAPSIVAASARAPDWLADAIYYAILAWFFAVLARSAYVALDPTRSRWVRALVTGLLLVTPLILPPQVLPNTSWWRRASVTPAGDVGNSVAGRFDAFATL